MARKITDMLEYIKSNISIDKNGCWNYKILGKGGYGRIQFMKDGKKTNTLAHRLTYSLVKGEIGDGLLVCHKCDNPMCCNPDHLFLGTSQDNSLDMVKKGRNHIHRAFGNNFSSRKVSICGKIYDSISAAARDIGISGNGLLKRIKSGKEGHYFCESSLGSKTLDFKSG